MSTPPHDPSAAPDPAASAVVPPDVEALARLAPVGLGVATLEGELLVANAALASILGVRDADSLSGASLARFHPEPALAAELLRGRLEAGVLEDVELDALNADGRALRLRASACLRPSADGGQLVLFAVSDVSEGGDSADDDAEERKREAVERFAAAVAHDYNNLLTTIIGEARQLLVDLPPSADSHESAQSIMRSAKRAAEITQRLLVFSRAEAGRPAAVELNDTVRELEGSLRDGLDPATSLVLRFDADAGSVWIDPGHLRLILKHLVGNAGEAVECGGRVVVETATIRAPDDTEGLDFNPPVPPGTYASLAVGDTGHGMDARTRRRIFDPFFTTKAPGRGAGLGLTTVYGLVLRASGHLAVISAPQWGTLVRVLLPVREPTTEPVPAQPPRRARSSAGGRPERAGRRKRVLVVDDEQPVLAVVSKILRRAGYVVHQAGGGYEAQDEIRRIGCELDLVISDVMMPGMRGTELVRWLRERCPGAVILLISGYADSDLVREWVEEDPESFLPKPFEPADLVERVHARVGPPVAGA